MNINQLLTFLKICKDRGGCTGHELVAMAANPTGYGFNADIIEGCYLAKNSDGDIGVIFTSDIEIVKNTKKSPECIILDAKD